MNRQEAIDILSTHYEPDDQRLEQALDMAIEALKAPHWIPCKERLPEDYENVLVYFEYYRYGDYNCMFSTYGIGDYSSEYDSWIVNGETGWRNLHVFAWLPLPEPFKEVEE